MKLYFVIYCGVLGSREYNFLPMGRLKYRISLYYENK
jgi:hypothetical protein